MDVDGEPYALWLVTLDSDRCCLVADCGPVVLSGEGRHLDAWIWRLKGVPSPQYKTELGFDPG